MAKARYIDFGEQHIAFVCLGCDEEHHVPAEKWSFNGDLEQPTLSPSLLITYRHPKGHSNDNPAPAGYSGEYEEERCHSFVKAGKIQYLPDCTHKLAGQTIDLPEYANNP